jgi:dihydrofolate reductase
MIVNAILACDMNFGIGYKGGLPWPKSKTDMRWFKDQTTNHVIIMGRATWESIGSKPLPQRTNVVVSTRDLEGPDYVTSGDIGQIIERVKEKYQNNTIWIIGGADIYEQSMQYCDKLYLTVFNRHYEHDKSIASSIIDDFPIVNYEKVELEEGIIFQIRERI